jgi:hypothetical protein
VEMGYHHEDAVISRRVEGLAGFNRNWIPPSQDQSLSLTRRMGVRNGTSGVQSSKIKCWNQQRTGRQTALGQHQQANFISSLARHQTKQGPWEGRVRGPTKSLPPTTGPQL